MVLFSNNFEGKMVHGRKLYPLSCLEGKAGLYYPIVDNGNYSTWLEIDLGAIRNNIQLLRKITGKQVMAVVKANGYGHGAIQVARAATSAGATWCGVSRVEEGLALRQAGLTCEILVLGYTPPAIIPAAIEGQLCVTVYDEEVVKAYIQNARGQPSKLRLHVKVETGMGRLGMAPEQALEFIRWLSHQDEVQVDGFFTHFARADEPAEDATRLQLARFDRVLDGLEAAGLRPPFVHAANSAGSLNFAESSYDLIRPGIAIYGLHPSLEAPLPSGFHPALSWKARLTSVKFLPAGHGVSYGALYTTHQTERIGVVPVGYADGFRRVSNQVVLINGKRFPVIGRVCMDQCTVQLDELPDARIGDEVVLIGQQGEERITAEELGKRWDTINYEVVCGLANRLQRLYIDQD